jgi:fluoroquinolone resistance protein
VFEQIFSQVDLTGIQIEKADFRTAYNYHLDPESNRLKGAKFSFHGLPGLLGKYGLEIE